MRAEPKLDISDSLEKNETKSVQNMNIKKILLFEIKRSSVFGFSIKWTLKVSFKKAGKNWKMINSDEL